MKPLPYAERIRAALQASRQDPSARLLCPEVLRCIEEVRVSLGYPPAPEPPPHG